MLQKLLQNQALQAFLAKIWKKFKQSNPIIAFGIMVALNIVIFLPSIAPEYGIQLPSWFSILVAIAIFWNNFNGADTFEILEKEKQLKDSE